MIDLSKLRAIDVHVHADVACHEPEDPVMGRFFDAASAYFKAPRERPRIPEIISHWITRLRPCTSRGRNLPVFSPR